MRRFEVLSNDRVFLVMERDEAWSAERSQQEALWWQVTLRDHHATATARVAATGEYLGAPLATFFVDLAGEWRGWKDAKTWESMEHTLKLSARHDGLGHIALRATLDYDPYPGAWSLAVTLNLDAGALDAIARDALAFA